MNGYYVNNEAIFFEQMLEERLQYAKKKKVFTACSQIIAIKYLFGCELYSVYSEENSFRFGMKWPVFGSTIPCVGLQICTMLNLVSNVIVCILCFYILR